MRKQVIAIIAVVAAIVVIGAVLIGIGSNNNNKEEQKVVDELGATAGVEDSIFEDTEIESDHEKGSEDIIDSGSNDQSGKDTSSAKNDSKNTSKENDKSKDKTESTDKTDKTDGDNTAGKDDSKQMDYESFHAMSPSDQQAYMESFDSVEKFFDWYNKAKTKYEKDNPAIEIDGGTVDLGDL